MSKQRRSEQEPEGTLPANLPPPAEVITPSARPSKDDVPAIWQVGDVILDLYEVTDILGEGGMGTVYKVHHRGWNMDLAVKSPKPEIFSKERGQENFVREAETWVNLGLHPHTVSCYYVRTLGGIPRVFAEYVEGGSLADWIRTRKLYEGGRQAALERILDIAIQFAWGLDYAHEQGLVHQDVKPANVMVTPDGTVKVTDFGLAKARMIAGEASTSGSQQSILVSTGGMTPAYCSPEQAAGQPLNRKTDIWSWGVSILEMFIGEVTWPAGQVAGEALESYLGVEPEGSVIPTTQAELVTLLRRCFQLNPENRPVTMEEVVTALQEIYLKEIRQLYPRLVSKPIEALADSLNNRAVSLLDLGKQAEAIKAWEQALQVQPNHPEATYNLGLILWRSDQATGDSLIRKLKDICASHPGEWKPIYMLALVHIERGDCQVANEILEEIEKMDVGRDEVDHALTLVVQERQASSQCLAQTFEWYEGMGIVNEICLSKDGRYALSAGGEKSVRLWDLATGRCLRTFEGHTDPVNSICLSEDDLYVLSGSTDGMLKLWEVATGHCLRTFKAPERLSEVQSVCLSKDGHYALSGSMDKTLKLWDVATGRCLRTFEGHDGGVQSVCLSKDGQYALSASSDYTLRLWEVSSSRCLRTVEEYAHSLCLSEDGQYVLSGSYKGALKLWEVATGHCLRTFEGHTGYGVESVSLSGDGRYALSSSDDRTLKLWEVSSGRCLRTFEHDDIGCWVTACLSKDGRYAMSAANNIRLWKIEWEENFSSFSAPIMVCRGLTSEIVQAAQTVYERAVVQAHQALVSGDAVTAAACIREARSQQGYERKEEAMKLWAELYVHLAKAAFREGWARDTLVGHSEEVSSVYISRDARFALSGSYDATLKLWDVDTGHHLHTFEGHERDYPVNSVYLSDDRRYALSGSNDKTLKLWEVDTGRCLRTFKGHTGGVNSVCLSRDGQYVLSGSMEGTLKLWEVATGRCLHTYEGHTDWVNSVCLSEDVRYALSGSGSSSRSGAKLVELRLWEVATGRCLRTFEGHRGPVTSVCLSADGLLALSGSADRTLRLWEVATGHCLRIFEGHTGWVDSVSMSGNGCYALSGSMDKTLKLWEVATGRCLRTFEGHTGMVFSVCLSENGCYALSGGEDKTLKVWVLDWELEDNQPTDWHEDARPYLETFLAAHTPYAGVLPQDREPTAEEITLALTRRGMPTWTDNDFQQLLQMLGSAGYGWLRPEGVQAELERMVAELSGAPIVARYLRHFLEKIILTVGSISKANPDHVQKQE